jgi:predicted TIM-barrel fold metal-dependent hydrolase
MKIDVFNHILPKKYFEKIVNIGPGGKNKGLEKRISHIPFLFDLDERFRIMDKFDGYVQIPCLPQPPVEAFGPPPISTDLARLANDEMANLVQKYSDRFLGFIATLPMNDPNGILFEAERAIKRLGAVGVEVCTNILGRPLDKPETMPLFDLMAELDRPIWIHPVRGADFPDYKSEAKSHYEMWWVFGWPYETSIAMAHLVFAGLFDRHPQIKIITHHMGGMVPYFEGRVGPGLDQLGTRTSDEDYVPLLKRLKKRPLEYFKMFYADTALFGAREATICGLKFFGTEKVLFASDAPFDPEKGSAYIRWTIEIIDSLEITPEERKAIYEGNARRLMML